MNVRTRDLRARRASRSLKKAFAALVCAALLASSTAPALAETDPLHERRMDIYIQALAMKKDYAKLSKVLLKEIEDTPASDTMRLMHLSKVAMDNEAQDAAKAGYEKVLAQEPGNLLAERDLGNLLFIRKSYVSALKLLDDYNKRSKGDCLSNFEQAEIIYAIKSGSAKKEADPFYQKAIEKAMPLGSSQDAQAICAQALFRLGRREEAAKAFAVIERKYPNDIFTTLTYASMLTEMELYDEADALLAKFPADLSRPDSLKRYKLDERQTKDAILQISLIRVAIQLARKNFFAVAAMQDSLEDRYPGNPELAFSRAAYYGAYSNWRGQLESLREARRGRPDDETLRKDEEQLAIEHGSYVQSSFEMRLGSDTNNKEFIFEEKGELWLAGGLRLGASYATDIARLHGVSWTDGQEHEFIGVRNKSEIYLQNDFMNGDSLKASFYDQDGIPGVGGGYKLLDYWGDTKLSGAFRSPYWDMPQAVAQKGGRSYVELERVLKPLEPLTITGKGSLNSYSLENSNDLARSFALGSREEYALPRLDIQKKLLGPESVFSLNHEFDFEKFSDIKSNSDDVKLYNPGDRQVHSFYLGFEDKITQQLKGALTGGFAYDAHAGSFSPVYSASVSYLFTPRLEGTVFVSQQVSTNKYFYAGASLKYNFANESFADILRKISASPRQQ